MYHLLAAMFAGMSFLSPENFRAGCKKTAPFPRRPVLSCRGPEIFCETVRILI
jgi:hypothetical protein